MDAEAYLKRQGWLGKGNALQPAKTTSLKRPLLVAKKVDVLGLGLSKHDVSDQWWLRAFDSSLKALGTGKKGMLEDVKKHGVKRGGLYGGFVRGEGLRGTIEIQEPAQETTGAKRKRSAEEKGMGKRKKTKEAAKDATRKDRLSPDAQIAQLAAEILSRSRGGTPTSDKDLPAIKLASKSAVSSSEEREARRLARGVIRARRKERRKQRTKA